MRKVIDYQGFVAGVIATVVMSVPMALATATGVSPLPKPVPIGIAALALGGGAKPVIVAVGFTLHLLYGGAWAAGVAKQRSTVSLVEGLTLGVGLWLIMQIVFLPALSWGVFGTAVTPKIAVATLVPHLLYGLTVAEVLSDGVSPSVNVLRKLADETAD